MEHWLGGQAMTADDVRRMYGETLERAPALPRYSVFHRECVAVLLLEIDRLKEVAKLAEKQFQHQRSDSIHDLVQRLYSSRKK